MPTMMVAGHGGFGLLCALCAAVVVLPVGWLQAREFWLSSSSPVSVLRSGRLTPQSTRINASDTERRWNDDDTLLQSNNSSSVLNPVQVREGSYPSYYKDPLLGAPPGITFDDLPIPIQVMEQYKKWHSVKALQRNPDLNHRTFAVGFYTCPMQAGNRMHHFFNSMLWAILTNRTLLWDYWDTETCLHWSQQNTICHSSNQVEDCDRILARADWIPSYDEWSRKFGLSEPVEIPYFAMHPKSDGFTLYKWHEGDEKLFGADDRAKYPMQVAVFGISVTELEFLGEEEVRNYLLHTKSGRTSCMLLYSYGATFLYGMLHRFSFDFAPLAKKGLADYKQPAADTYTIALHSRHLISENDGCDVHREMKCLRTITPRQTWRPIEVTIMADRICTITKLTHFLKRRNITVHVAPHEEGESYRDEHGPFAGVGFYQDLALASQARSGLIASRRTSSDLLRELMVFNRGMEWWGAGHDISQLSDLDFCFVTHKEEMIGTAKKLRSSN